MLGSLTGSDPGFACRGVHIPLAYDALMVKCARQDWVPSMQNFDGLLDHNGDGVSRLVALTGELSA